MRISDWSSDVCSSDLGIKQLFRCSVPEIELYEVAGFEGAFAQAEQSGPQGLTFDESITRHQDPLWQLVAGFPRVNSGQAVRPAFPACENYLLPVAGPPDIRRSIEFADCRWAREIGDRKSTRLNSSP